MTTMKPDLWPIKVSNRENKNRKKLSLPVLDNKEDNHDENRNQNTPEN